MISAGVVSIIGMKLSRICWFWLLFFVAFPLAAQGGGRLPLKAYGIEQGLMSEVVWCLGQDRDGVMWAGTDVGLHRFDGQRFHVYEGALPSQKISCLRALENGELLVGTHGGLALVQGGQCQTLGPDRGLPLEPVVDLAQDGSGAWWVLTQEALFRETGSLRFQPAPAWPKAARPRAIWPARDGQELRAAQDRALGLFRPGEAAWTWEPVAALGPQESILGLALDGTGQTWLRTSAGLLRRPVGTSNWIRVVHNQGLDTRSALGIRVDREGWLWVDTPQGLLRFRGEARDVPPWHVPQGSGVMQDREGSTWIWSARGVHRVLGHRLLRTWGTEEGLPSLLVFQALRDDRGRLWLGTRGGLCLATELGWRLVRPGGVLWLARASDGAIWFAGVPGGFAGRVDPETLRIREFRVDPHPTSQNARGIAVDRQGRVWLADITSGLVVGTPQTGGAVAWAVPAGAPTGTITGLFQDAEDRLIVLHGDQVSIHEANRWSTLSETLPALPYQAVALPDGDLLISYRRSPTLTRHRIGPSGWQRVGTLEPFRDFPQVMVYSLGADARGRIWMGTNRGLVRYELATGRSLLFGPMEGLPSADCVTRAMLVEDNADIWLGTVAGLVRYQGGPEPPAGTPPAPVLLEVRDGSQPAAFPLERLEIPQGMQDLNFRFVVPSYVHPTRLIYQVRMRGVDLDWRTLTEPIAHYGALRGGDHQLELRSLRAGEPPGPVRCVDFHVTPAWHETAWGTALVLLGVCGILALAYAWRMRALRGRNLELERLVAARTGELAEAKSAAERASAFKSLFLATTTHDLRTPLHAILGFSRLAMEGTAEALRHVQRVHGAATGMLQLVNNLLDLGKIEAGQMDFQIRPFDPARLLREVGDLLREGAEEKGVRLEVRLDPDLQACVAGDPLRVRQIVTNLLGNAVKFTSKGQVILRAIRLPGGLQIEVEDSGSGIPEELRSVLFDAYVQGAGAPGTGLGLAITRQLARQMGGDVEVESQVGIGSTFRCWLPLPSSEEPCTEEPRPMATSLGILRGRVLVADDNPSNRLLAVTCLGQLGLEVEAVEDGRQVLEALDRAHFDAVIVDGRMPGLTGPQTLAAIRHRPEGGALPVLLFTASLAPDSHEGEFSFDATLLKPAELPDFRRVLIRFLPVEDWDTEGRLTHLDRHRVAQLREVLGDQEALDDFAQAFREDALRRLARMAELLAQRENGALSGVAHDLKTNAGNLGLTYLARAAMAMEQEAAHADGARLESLHERIEAAVKEAFTLLDEGRLREDG